MDQNMKGIISVILGLLGLIGIITSHTGIGILLCIAGAIAAVITFEDSEVKHGTAKAGMVSSMAGILVLLILFRVGGSEQAVTVANATPDQVDSAKEETVFTKDGLSISVSGFKIDGAATDVSFSVSNASEEEYSLEALTCSVNGEMVEGELSGTDPMLVSAGQTVPLVLPVDSRSVLEMEVIFRAYSGDSLKWDSGTITIENN
jgi:hypothetical protein